MGLDDRGATGADEANGTFRARDSGVGLGEERGRQSPEERTTRWYSEHGTGSVV